MSGRRSDPATIPPARRRLNGVLYVGRAPWFRCSRCPTYFDPAECEACPACIEESAEILRLHAEDLRLWAAETLANSNTTIE